jgi:hypothetical protein
MDETGARLDIIVEALDAAAASLGRARERNVPRRRVPAALRRAGPLAPFALRLYNTLFVAQREISADQNDALVALLNAMREIVRLQRASLSSRE